MADFKEYTVKVYANGTNSWHLNDKLHREDGPAVDYANGIKEWYLDGERHREDGPAIEWSNGDRFWYLNDKLHREDGPAIEHANGDRFWYLNDKQLSEAEHRQATAKTKELTVAEISELLGYEVKVVK